LQCKSLYASLIFVRVVDTGSFSAAARQLGVGLPALSKMVAQLEDQRGVQLLIRSTQRLTPTKAGCKFHEGAKRTLDNADVGVRGGSASLSGARRVSATVTFARLHIVPISPYASADDEAIKGGGEIEEEAHEAEIGRQMRG
jgi:DNA-binding transcriptional LysR family regulator